MYRGFQSYRHFINYSLHSLSTVICGDDTVLRAELARLGVSSTKDLPYKEARRLYNELSFIAKGASRNLNMLKTAIGQGGMTKRQRAMIVRITKYVFLWSPEATFSFIIEMFPDYRKRLTIWEVQNSKLNKLFGILTGKDADKLIKRLIKIEKRNFEKKNVE